VRAGIPNAIRAIVIGSESVTLGRGRVMADRGEYERWRESEAERLIASGRVDTDTVRELLILTCHSSPLARQFFKDRLGNEATLSVLLGLAIEGYSGDAQMTASYWVSQFPADLLRLHVSELEMLLRTSGKVFRSTHAKR
jgi:hypothetical protein